MNEIIRTKNLTKHFGSVKATDKISLSVRKGEIYGFLGLNGAGKTTTIRMLLGMIKPTSGESYLKGEKIGANTHKLWNSIGYLVEIPYSYPELTVRENLEIFRRLHLLDDSGSVDVVIKKLHLGRYQNRKAKNLSLGNAQRLGLAKAIIHDPDILILDEPANGLDPAGIVEIRELLHDLAFNKGVTIFISSHILGEIAKIATRIGIIHEGRLIQEMDINQLHKLRKRWLLINVEDKDGTISILTKEGYNPVITEDGFLKITNKDAINHPETVNALLVHGGFVPDLLKVEEEDLETYFLRIIGEMDVIE